MELLTSLFSYMTWPYFLASTYPQPITWSEPFLQEGLVSQAGIRKMLGQTWATQPNALPSR